MIHQVTSISQSNSKATRVAVWGIGAHAVRTILPALAGHEDVQLIGLHSRNPEVLETQCQLYDCHAWFDPLAMLESEDIDAVFVATPTAFHANHGTQVLNHGKHLWCEKPLATNLNEARQMLELAKAKELSLAVVCAPLYHGLFKTLQKEMAQGRLGRIERIQAAFRFPHLKPDNFRYRADLGGGALLDVGFYLLSVIDELVDGDLVDMQCDIRSDHGYSVDTSGSALLSFDAGCKADVSWGYGFDYENRVHIVGEKGSLNASPFFSKPTSHKIEAHLRSGDGDKTPLAFDNNDQFKQMIDDFCLSLNHQATRDRLIAFALRSQELLDEAVLTNRA